MLKELKFVQGAIAKKDLIPAMTHFAIENNTVRSFNGCIALCAPIPVDINCRPKAIPMVQAIDNCSNDVITMSMTPAGRLRIQSGEFRVFIDCIDEETPHVLPEGEYIDINGEDFLKAFKILLPFIGDDASRKWTNGILLRNHSAFATNNVCLVEYWLDSQVPFSINIPSAAIKEILRIKEVPINVQLSESNITFHYSDGRWIRTQLNTAQWPDLNKILDQDCQPIPINPNLFSGIAAIKPFVDKLGRIFFEHGIIRTHLEENEGATYEIENFPFNGVYNIDMLELLNGVVNKIDFTTYPKPCLFFNNKLRGAIIGMVI